MRGSTRRVVLLHRFGFFAFQVLAAQLLARPQLSKELPRGWQHVVMPVARQFLNKSFLLGDARRALGDVPLRLLKRGFWRFHENRCIDKDGNSAAETIREAMSLCRQAASTSDLSSTLDAQLMEGELPIFELSNGAVGFGPFRQKLGTERTVQLNEHCWEVLGVPVYVYLTGSIPEGGLPAALQHCEREIAGWLT